MNWHSRPNSKLVPYPQATLFSPMLTRVFLDAKARKEMADKAKGKGPMNAGQQGIKKSGKK